VVDSDGFDWSAYYRAQFEEAINPDTIAAFAAKYKGSEEEGEDVLAAYEEGEGDLDYLYENVMLSNVLEDDERFRRIIDEGIANGDVTAYAAYKKESKKKREARKKAAKAEAEEAEEMAKELGVHDQLFGGGGKGKEGKKAKAKAKDKGSSEDALKALIQQRSQGSLDSLIDSLEAKYGGGSKGKKGKKKASEPTEEEFEAAAANIKKRNGEEPSSGRSKRARR
jgi:DnaJ homolog subfamily C member 9